MNQSLDQLIEAAMLLLLAAAAARARPASLTRLAVESYVSCFPCGGWEKASDVSNETEFETFGANKVSDAHDLEFSLLD